MATEVTRAEANHGGVQGAPVKKPAPAFEKLGVNPDLLPALDKLGLTQPNEVQAPLIQGICNGSSVVVQSPSRQGRLLAVCIGILHVLMSDRDKRAFVLTFTQEVAVRLRETLQMLSVHLEGVDASCYAAVKDTLLRDDVKQLRDGGPRVVIGQPTRLNLLRKKVSFDGFAIAVLLQAEHLLDDKYEAHIDEDIASLLEALPPADSRLTIVCSTKPLPQAAVQLLTSGAVDIKVRMPELTMTNTYSLFYGVPGGADEFAKVATFWPLYESVDIAQIIFYCEDAPSVNRVRDLLADRGLSTKELYAHDPNPVKRDQVLRDFMVQQVQALITDIKVTEEPLAQIDGPDAVVHLSMPATATEFKNRAGRCIRGARKRLSVSFAGSAEEESKLEEYQKDLRIELIEMVDDNAN